MNTLADQISEIKSRSAANATTQAKSNKSTPLVADHRQSTAQMKTLQQQINNSPRVQPLAQLQKKLDERTSTPKPAIQKKENKTGPPNNLKAGIENLSGYSMDDVKVHYNSDKPAQLQAHAYAQGTNIHLGPGQEKHLPHEAWHVVQQKQGRVKPTIQMKGGVNVNDDKGLEKEADVMGARASLGGKHKIEDIYNQAKTSREGIVQKTGNNLPVIQKNEEEPKVERKKDEYQEGDLFYGFNEPRDKGKKKLVQEAEKQLEREGGKQLDDTIPTTIDELNINTFLESFQDHKNDDFMEAYFKLLETLKKYQYDDKKSPTENSWMNFLKNNLDYLSIDKHIAQIQSNEDRVAKNITDNEFDKKNVALAIVAAYHNKGLPKDNEKSRENVNIWVGTLLIRRACKLGIKFTIERKKVIHMNTYAAPFEEQKNDSRVNIVAANPTSGYGPITHSEMRYIIRNYGADHTKIHFYYLRSKKEQINHYGLEVP